jgi:hypothetical protein
LADQGSSGLEHGLLGGVGPAPELEGVVAVVFDPMRQQCA